jgi:hypothetical protein
MKNQEALPTTCCVLEKKEVEKTLVKAILAGLL